MQFCIHFTDFRLHLWLERNFYTNFRWGKCLLWVLTNHYQSFLISAIYFQRKSFVFTNCKKLEEKKYIQIQNPLYWLIRFSRDGTYVGLIPDSRWLHWLGSATQAVIEPELSAHCGDLPLWLSIRCHISLFFNFLYDIIIKILLF